MTGAPYTNPMLPPPVTGRSFRRIALEWSKYSNVFSRRYLSSYFQRQACIRRVYRESLTTGIDNSQAFLNCCITKRLVSTHYMVDHTSMGQR
jgi:hypothetical protein